MIKFKRDRGKELADSFSLERYSLNLYWSLIYNARVKQQIQNIPRTFANIIVLI